MKTWSRASWAKNVPLRFTSYEKPGLFQRIFGAK